MTRNAGGRPKTSEGERGTRQARVFEDLAEMIAWVVRVKGGSAAQLLDPMIRPGIVAMYKAIEPEVEKIKRADEALKRVEEAAALKHRRGGSAE